MKKYLVSINTIKNSEEEINKGGLVFQGFDFCIIDDKEIILDKINFILSKINKNVLSINIEETNEDKLKVWTFEEIEKEIILNRNKQW